MTPAEIVLTAGWKAALERNDHDQAGRLETALEATGQPAKALADMHRAAIWYANRGLAVFPVMPGEKRPLPGTHGVKDATCDHEVIGRWFEMYANAEGRSLNIGIACGGRFDVLDIDGPTGAECFTKHLGDGSWLTVAAVSETPRGVHLWTPAVPGAANGQNDQTGIDYRTAGGYVVAPPSHVGGTVYRWLQPPEGP